MSIKTTYVFVEGNQPYIKTDESGSIKNSQGQSIDVWRPVQINWVPINY